MCSTSGLPKYIKTKVLSTCFYLIWSFFKKTKWGLGLVSLPNFLQDFWWNIFLMLYFIWLNFIAWLPLLLELLSNMCIVITCCPLWDVIDFEINHSFLFTPFFYMTKRSAQKCKYLKKNKKYNCYGPLAFKSQRVAYQCNQKLLHYC